MVNKKKYHLYFLISLIPLYILFFSNILAQTPQQLLYQGNNLFQNQQYAQAVEAYEKILKQGYESSVLYYNLGNAFFKEGKLGRAIFCYEKGLKLEPNDEDITYNLRLANARTVDKLSEVPKIFLVAWWEGLITSISMNGWSILVVLTFWILLTSITFYFFSKRSNIQRLSFMTGSISLAVLILVLVIMAARVNRDSTTDYGILLESLYSVKVTPDEKSNDAFIIHEGIKFSIEDKVNDWAKIRLSDGKIGWIQKHAFGQI